MIESLCRDRQEGNSDPACYSKSERARDSRSMLTVETRPRVIGAGTMMQGRGQASTDPQEEVPPAPAIVVACACWSHANFAPEGSLILHLNPATLNFFSLGRRKK